MGPRSVSLLLAGVVALGVLAVVEPVARAVATIPLPVPATVMDETGYATFSDGSAIARFNLTFQLSPNDPDQTNGAWAYGLGGGNTFQSTFGFSLNNSTYPIPGRPGWVQVNATFTFDVCRLNDLCSNGGVSSRLFAYNVSAFNAGAQQAPTAGCTVSTDWSLAPIINNLPSDTTAGDGVVNPVETRGYWSCGNAVSDLPGVNAIVTTPYGGVPGSASVTNLTWLLSASDPNQTVGAFDYYVFHSYILSSSSNGTRCGVDRTGAAACVPFLGFLDPINFADFTGLRGGNVTGFGGNGQFNNLFLQVMARDNLTHQRTNLSCVVAVQEGVQFSGAGCGALPAPAGSGGSLGAPAFPGLNVGVWASQTGLSTDGAGWLLGGVVVAFTSLGGFIAARTIGGLLGVLLGIIAAEQLSLWPLWLMVVFFMGALVGITLLARGSAGGGASQ